MPKMKYIDKKFYKKRLDLISKANAIILEYLEQGFDLTLRQLYYQLVARGIIPNTQKEYKNLSVTISDARLAGLIDWNAIVDRTRILRSNTHWQSPAEILEASIFGYALDKWKPQPCRPEVWIEKDALVGVIDSVCRDLDIKYIAVRGYNSQSEMWRAGHGRFRRNGQRPCVIHLGDHDPSGLDMTRDIEDRLKLFVGESVEVKRVALNYDQIEQYNPPPNFAKITDPRAKEYMAEFGQESWELDALDPVVIASLIREAVTSLRDETLWQEMVDRENSDIGKLKGMIEASK